MKLARIAAFAVTALVMLAVGQLVADDAQKVDLSKIKCVVSGEAVDPDAVSKHNDGTIYFCCGNCKGAFEKEGGKEKFAAKANHQLVATKQAKQKGCPMSGKDVDPDATVKIAGVDVSFCCGNCKGAAEKKEGNDQINLVFNDKAFAKAFEVIKN